MKRYRGIGRRRERNMVEPSQTTVERSVAALVTRARELAQADHRGSLVTGTELDAVVSVYLRRAMARAMGESAEEAVAL